MNPTENAEKALAERRDMLSSEGRSNRMGSATAQALNAVRRSCLGDRQGFPGRGFIFSLTALTLTLTACATPQSPTITYQPVSKIVVASCIPKSVPQAPIIHTDGELRTMEPASRYLAIAADRAALFAWRWTVGPVIEDCRQAGE